MSTPHTAEMMMGTVSGGRRGNFEAIRMPPNTTRAIESTAIRSTGGIFRFASHASATRAGRPGIGPGAVGAVGTVTGSPPWS